MWDHSCEEAKGGPLPLSLRENSGFVRLTTGRAAVGPLTRVPHTVLHQLPLHVEGLPTLIAGEHLVSCVRLLVLLQIAEIAEP